MQETMEITEPEALRALAHPVRQRILMQLSVLEHARAADLAEAIGQPANSVSFHLRVLAKAGMIVEAPEHARDKRDRVWTNVAQSYRVKSDSPGAGEAIVRPALQWTADVFAHHDGDDDAAKRQFMLLTMLLTKEEADQMALEIAELLSRWADRSHQAARDEPAVAREVYQVLSAFGPRDDVSGETAREPTV
ncbi:ArsR/SmtB family transcription factor [Isoptericola variabilis]|uniref:ArsR/SmtB family transcription factor n=1 Tax=Isoptericola variabilis TaxID=139208 RepID=UPI003D1957C0